MSPRSLIFATVACLAPAATSAPALAQDAQICMAAAERVAEGEILADADKSAGHEACQRALAESSNVVQKYHLQEADFDIMGTRPKQ
jgi:hypothetical protein